MYYHEDISWLYGNIAIVEFEKLKRKKSGVGNPSEIFLELEKR
jgi:hypothetical protein